MFCMESEKKKKQMEVKEETVVGENHQLGIKNY